MFAAEYHRDIFLYAEYPRGTYIDVWFQIVSVNRKVHMRCVWVVKYL